MPNIDDHGAHRAAQAHSAAANAGADPTACLAAALEAYHAHLVDTGQLAGDPTPDPSPELAAQWLAAKSGYHRYTAPDGWLRLLGGEEAVGPIEHAAKEALFAHTGDQAQLRAIAEVRRYLIDTARTAVSKS